MIRRVLACLMLVLSAAPSASATDTGLRMMRNWAEADKCTREAQQAFPDYSAEAYAKRDARVRDCLAAHHLPPREPLAPGR